MAKKCVRILNTQYLSVDSSLRFHSYQFRICILNAATQHKYFVFMQYRTEVCAIPDNDFDYFIKAVQRVAQFFDFDRRAFGAILSFELCEQTQNRAESTNTDICALGRNASFIFNEYDVGAIELSIGCLEGAIKKL